jgi:SAM-dependent methyltransferase
LPGRPARRLITKIADAVTDISGIACVIASRTAADPGRNPVALVCQIVAVESYAAINMANWDERAPAHAASADYHVSDFIADPAYLSQVVRFDLPRLGDISGLRGVHLQCHIGTDTISLARLGASMIGLDFSRPAIEHARDLARRTGANAEFVESDVYDAAEVLPAGSFDLVFTGIGALCWLPSVRRWAQVVADLLRPGGRLFIREGHPMLWALQDNRDDLLVVDYSYFETAEPLVFDEPGTYVATETQFAHNVTHEWNHGLGEIVTALFDAGMSLTALTEHDSVPWEALPGQMELVGDHEWRLADRPERLAASYTLQATKRS